MILEEVNAAPLATGPVSHYWNISQQEQNESVIFKN